MNIGRGDRILKSLKLYNGNPGKGARFLPQEAQYPEFKNTQGCNSMVVSVNIAGESGWEKDPLLKMISSVKNSDLREHGVLYFRLYRILRFGDRIDRKALDGMLPTPQKGKNSSANTAEDMLERLEDAELSLLLDDREIFLLRVEELRKLSLTNIYVVNEDPFYLQNKVGILEALAGQYPETLEKAFKLAENLPARSDEAGIAFQNIASTAIDCVHILGPENKLLDFISKSLKRISKKEIRQEAYAFAVRKLCMRDETTPATSIDLIEFAEKSLLPAITEILDLTFTNIQIAVAKSLLANASGNEKKKELQSESMEYFRKAKDSLSSRSPEPYKLMLDFNLIRGFAQAGMDEESRKAKSRLLQDFEKDVKNTRDTINMLAQERASLGGRLPHDLKAMEDELTEMAEDQFMTLGMAITLAARFARNEEFAVSCIHDAHRIIRDIPMMHAKLQTILQLGTVYSFRNEPAKALEVFREAFIIVNNGQKNVAKELFYRDMAEACAEAYFFSPNEALLDEYLKSARKTPLNSNELDRSFLTFLTRIYFQARSYKWKMNFNG